MSLNLMNFEIEISSRVKLSNVFDQQIKINDYKLISKNMKRLKVHAIKVDLFS